MSENCIKQTSKGWVDLRDIPMRKNSFYWDKAINIPIAFKYEDIVSTITITERKNEQYFYIDIPGYVNHHAIYVGQIKNGQLGRCLGKITDKFKFSVGDIFNGVEILDMWTQDDGGHGHKYLKCKCIIDGYVWTIREDHLNSGHGCPICRNSIGEKRIKKYLIERGIEFIPQYSFSDCKYKKALVFDFYLPELNVCVEYDGIQHFQPVDFAGKGKEWAKKQFEESKLRDEIKNSYCKSHNIKILRIKYTQDVDNVLDDFFQEISYKNSAAE